LRHLLFAPAGAGPHPLLVFLHGYDEAAPQPMDTALRRHGPLRAGNPAWIQDRFAILAPQLPRAGDDWHCFAQSVAELVEQVGKKHSIDAQRMYLTGFSFGANGVFDLAQGAHGWAALWAVDPTRVPRHEIEVPVWVSFGEVARWRKAEFIEALRLVPALESDRVFTDTGDDHVGSARRAYSDLAPYEWLLRQSRKW
jgi:hypothetical protein